MEDAQTVLGKNVDQALSVDISFWKDGVEVEPSQAVTVQLSSDAFAKGEEITVIHDVDKVRSMPLQPQQAIM